MGGLGGGNVAGAMEAELKEIEVGEELFAGAEEDGREDEVHFVDEAGAEDLLNGGDPTADANVFAVGGGAGERGSGFDAAR